MNLSATQGIKHRNIKLPDLLKGKYIELDLKEREKTKLITELVDKVPKHSRIKNGGVLFKAILGREELGLTAIGNGVAIPHVRLREVKKPILILGRFLEGVDFDALDWEKTYLFFCSFRLRKKLGFILKS
jgi:mannitol/fructose-specific phosphotransferase system IIA component (Ntr-type)